MFRIRSLSLPGVALALAASCSSSAPPPDPLPTTPPTPSNDSIAVALGVTVDARGSNNEPRLIRAVVPRQSIAGMTVEQAARDHLTALTPLWLKHQQPAPMKLNGTQTLRSGAAIVRFQQQVNGLDIHGGQIHVMVQPGGALAAVSGVMRPSSARTTFRSTPVAAVDAVLDTLFGANRARPAIVPGTDVKAGWTELAIDSTPQFRVVSARAKRELLIESGKTAPIYTLEVVAEKQGLDD
jgi:hypothetical protein